MIKEICNEIDVCIEKKLRNNERLLELIFEVISNENKYSKDLAEMCYDIHELDTDTAETVEIYRDNNLKNPDCFTNELKNIKKKYKEYNAIRERYT